VDVAILTVGDELLAGDTENTNATWIARELADRGVGVARILVVPDDRAVIAEAIERYREAFDRVVVTGGLGGTHDDVTMAAVADALDRGLAVDDEARRAVVETIAAFREANPELVEEYPDMEIDVDAQASIPEDARAIANPVGLAPGCVADGVYVLPGIPEEMKAAFGTVADEFAGETASETLYTPAPEGALAARLDELRSRYPVSVGSYPDRGGGHNRIKVTGDADAVAKAVTWVRENVTVVDPDGGDTERSDRRGDAGSDDAEE
jgi:molybdenum cofactor synthesis domain-containing protein